MVYRALGLDRVKRPLGKLKITPEMCIGDELCVRRCPVGILELTKEEVNAKGYHYVRIKPGREIDCIACSICEKVCPTNAIYVEHEEELTVKDYITKAGNPTPTTTTSASTSNRVLILGGGIAGIEAALALANMGYRVTLVEKSPAIGGKMAMLDKTFPTLDCSICIEGPLMSDVSANKNIEVLTTAELMELRGEPGRYRARILVKPRYVTDECTKCGKCEEVCPVTVPSEYNAGIGLRKAIYLPFPQAEPGIYAIDPDLCLNKPPENIACNRCVSVCEPRTILFTMMPRIIEREVAAVIVATGYELEGGEVLTKYGYGKHPDVLTAMEFERLVNATGPSMGEVVKLGNHGHPRKVLLLSCIGSRTSKANPYCSKVCCEYTLKQAIYAKNHGIEDVAVLYMNDVRTYGKGFENLYQRAVEAGIKIMHGRPLIMSNGNGSIKVKYEDTRSKEVKIEDYDMVILAPAIKPPRELYKLANTLGLELDRYGFIRVNPANPVETNIPGIFVAGSASGPTDITESVLMGLAAAAQAVNLMGKAVTEGEEFRETIEPKETRTGVFICHCGSNIAGIADINELVRVSRGLPNVVHVEDVPFACSKAGLDKITESIKRNNLSRVVVAACSPATHLRFFQDAARRAGLNPYLVEMTNIRNLDTWVHSDRRAATEKAKDMIKMAVAKAPLMKPFRPEKHSVVKRALIIGCGPAGLAAANTLANAGVETIIVEISDRCGGNYNNELLTKYLPEGNRISGIMNRLLNILSNPRVRVYYGTTVKEITGFTGNFHVTLSNGQEIDAGAIIVATGAKPIDASDYGFNGDPRVMTIHELIQGTRKFGSNVLFLDLCNKPYCQAIMLNMALLLRRLGSNVYVVVRDLMTVGTQYEDLYREARKANVAILRIPRDGEVRKHVILNNDTAAVRDVELGNDVSIPIDTVILNIPMKPNSDEISKVLRLSRDQEGFLMEAHPKLGPVDTMTPGIFIAGAVRANRSFGEAVLEGYAAAARALTLLSRDYIIKEVSVPRVDPGKCVGCLLCVKACPYGAIKGEPGKPVTIDPAACQGCGSCVGECPYGALDMDLLSDDAIMAQIDAALAEEPERKVVM
ncbi:FAD-dependent oxidoreductase, partial [Vulcanisaeta souniana]